MELMLFLKKLNCDMFYNIEHNHKDDWTGIDDSGYRWSE